MDASNCNFIDHDILEVLEEFKTGELEITSEYISLIFSCLDRLSILVEELREEKELQREQIVDLLVELEKVEHHVGIGVTSSQPTDMTEGQLSVSFHQLEESDLFVIEQAVEGRAVRWPAQQGGRKARAENVTIE